MDNWVERTILACILLPLCFATYSFFDVFADKQEAAGRRLDALSACLREHASANAGVYPGSITPCTNERDPFYSTKDLWGRPLLYIVQAEAFTISSAGPDGVFGTSDDIVRPLRVTIH